MKVFNVAKLCLLAAMSMQLACGGSNPFADVTGSSSSDDGDDSSSNDDSGDASSSMEGLALNAAFNVEGTSALSYDETSLALTQAGQPSQLQCQFAAVAEKTLAEMTDIAGGTLCHISVDDRFKFPEVGKENKYKVIFEGGGPGGPGDEGEHEDGSGGDEEFPEDEFGNEEFALAGDTAIYLILKRVTDEDGKETNVIHLCQRDDIGFHQESYYVRADQNEETGDEIRTGRIVHAGAFTFGEEKVTTGLNINFSIEGPFDPESGEFERQDMVKVNLRRGESGGSVNHKEFTHYEYEDGEGKLLFGRNGTMAFEGAEFSHKDGGAAVFNEETDENYGVIAFYATDGTGSFGSAQRQSWDGDNNVVDESFELDNGEVPQPPEEDNVSLVSDHPGCALAESAADLEESNDEVTVITMGEADLAAHDVCEEVHDHEEFNAEEVCFQDHFVEAEDHGDFDPDAQGDDEIEPDFGDFEDPSEITLK